MHTRVVYLFFGHWMLCSVLLLLFFTIDGISTSGRIFFPFPSFFYFCLLLFQCSLATSTAWRHVCNKVVLWSPQKFMAKFYPYNTIFSLNLNHGSKLKKEGAKGSRWIYISLLSFIRVYAWMNMHLFDVYILS